MQSDIKFSSFASKETVESTHHIVLFENNYLFTEHRQSSGSGESRQTCSDYGNFEVVILLLNVRLIYWNTKGKTSI